MGDMANQVDHGAQRIADGNEFDAAAQKGWNFFTKFLLANVVSVVATLLVIGLLTVWR